MLQPVSLHELLCACVSQETQKRNWVNGHAHYQDKSHRNALLRAAARHTPTRNIGEFYFSPLAFPHYLHFTLLHSLNTL